MIWIPVYIGFLFAVNAILTMWTHADSAIQEAAQAGKAMAYVVIPYCLCRAIDSTREPRREDKIKIIVIMLFAVLAAIILMEKGIP